MPNCPQVDEAIRKAFEYLLGLSDEELGAELERRPSGPFSEIQEYLESMGMSLYFGDEENG